MKNLIWSCLIPALAIAPEAIAQTLIEIPKTNFFPNTVPDRSPPPAKPLSETASDLVPKPPKPPAVVTSNKTPSPLQRPLFRLFGFETAYTLKQQELVFRIGGTSFNNPLDFRGAGNRSNDTTVGISYGITDNLQLSVDVSGKDDTIFNNLVRPDSSFALFNGTIPVTLKWKYLEQDNLTAAAVLGAEFSSPFPALFTRGGRSFFYSDPSGALRADDNSTYFSVALPVSYRVNNELSLTLNPQVSFFPSSIAASTTGNLINQNIGLNGDRLNYYGTVAGIGIGINYLVTPKLQFAADITPILSGRNSVGSTDNSLFVNRAVWNVGLQYAPNSRTAASIYATNRFSPSQSSPSNLLVQPNGEYAVGLQISFLPDFNGQFEIEKRQSYPNASAFFTNLNGLPSTVLPINSVLYQLGFGTNGRVSPTIRIGLLDDLELALNFSDNNTEALPIEGSIMARLALVPDEGKDLSYASTVGLGLILNGARNRNLENAVSLYADLPTSYRLENYGLDLMVTPKLIVPAEFQGIQNIFGVTLGASLKVAENTRLLGEYTPILSGSNQLQNSPTPGIFQVTPIQGRTGIFNIGIRQLFPNGNSVYALDLYYTNSGGDYGLQGITALPNGGTQVGFRFNILNGAP